MRGSFRADDQHKPHHVFFDTGITTTTDDELWTRPVIAIACFHESLFENCEGVNCERDVLLFLETIER
jgi:hypothetical protein